MPQKLTERVLVAEIDEHGAVSFVWVKRKWAKHARPVRDAAEISRRVAEFEVVGAPHEDVLTWLNAHS